MSVVELSNPTRVAKLQRAMLTRLGLGAPAVELIAAGRDHHTWRNCKRNEERFSTRNPVHLEPVTCFQSNIDRCHEVFPRFEDALGIRHTGVLIFDERLPNPAQRAVFRRTRLISAT